MLATPDKVLVVPAGAAADLLQGQPFKALPQEEIDRHYASIELEAADHQGAQVDPSVTPLSVQVVSHFNYSWLTHCAGSDRSGPRSLGIGAPLTVPGDDSLFLDEAWIDTAAAVIEQELLLPDAPELRLAGLLDDGGGRLDVVYVARLRQPGAESRGRRVSNIAFTGTGELQQARGGLDPWSQILVDSLQAF